MSWELITSSSSLLTRVSVLYNDKIPQHTIHAFLHLIPKPISVAQDLSLP